MRSGRSKTLLAMVSPASASVVILAKETAVDIPRKSILARITFFLRISEALQIELHIVRKINM